MSQIHVSDWYRTLLGAALSNDVEGDRAAAWQLLNHTLSVGPIDSVDQWAALSSNSTVPLRNEILLAGIDTDKQGAAIRIGDFKLIVGDWGGTKKETWCDLNMSGFSPHFPAPIDPNPHAHGPGGLGGLYCDYLPNSSSSYPLGADAEWLEPGTAQCGVTAHTKYADPNISVVVLEAPNECCALCSSHAGCAVAVFDKPSRTCTLHSSAKHNVTVRTGSVAFQPNVSPPPSPPHPHHRPTNWTNVIRGLYNVANDPRETTDLQDQMPDLVASMHARLVFWNRTTVPSIHNKTRDPEAKAMAQLTSCMSPWQDWMAPSTKP
eukprot:COSAG01_NODE_1910_length_8928_cov_33.079964_3_plen_320_part_00